jgi:uncharacterized protein YndB with AHSA1/START domain
VKWVVIILGSILAIVLIAFVVGVMLPRDHVASSTAVVRGSPDEVWRAITTVSDFPRWRNDVKRVEVLDSASGRLRWREETGFGPMTLEQVEAEPPRRFVTRLADTSDGFGGTWTYEIAPEAAGSRVTITERGFVDNALFRFMSRFIFGHYRTQQDYLRALGKRFGEEVIPEKVAERSRSSGGGRAASAGPLPAEGPATTS